MTVQAEEVLEDDGASTPPPVVRGPRNTAEVGIVAELHVRTRLAELGYVVYLPEGHGSRSDLLYEDLVTGKVTKVQVKTARFQNGCVVFQSCSVNGFTGKKTGYHGQVDEFMVWSPTTRKAYRFPVSTCGASEVALRVEEPRGTARATIRWAKDYEL